MSYVLNPLGKVLLSRGTGNYNFPTIVRYGTTPVVTKGLLGSWEDTDVANPDVKWDTLTNQWVMNYSGFDGSQWHTGLAYSDDLITWTKEATNPVFSPILGEGYIAANGSIVTIGSTYYLYYQSVPATNTFVYCATSPDMLNWTRANGGNPVIPVGASGQWDDTQTFDPFARTWPDGTVEVFYVGDDGSGNRGIGHAISTDGINFTKLGKLLDEFSGDLDVNLGAVSVYGNQLDYVLYHDSSRYDGYRYTCRAWTTDGGTSFTREWAVFTRLEPYPTGAWDGEQVFDMNLVFYNGTLYHFYAGATIAGPAENLNAQIGLATAEWPMRRLIS